MIWGKTSTWCKKTIQVYSAGWGRIWIWDKPTSWGIRPAIWGKTLIWSKTVIWDKTAICGKTAMRGKAAICGKTAIRGYQAI